MMLFIDKLTWARALLHMAPDKAGSPKHMKHYLKHTQQVIFNCSHGLEHGLDKPLFIIENWISVLILHISMYRHSFVVYSWSNLQILSIKLQKSMKLNLNQFLKFSLASLNNPWFCIKFMH